jgi:phospholipase/carboxylesterase
MNRLQKSKASKLKSSSASHSSLVSGHWPARAFPTVDARPREGRPLYSLFVPMHYERAYAYPLLVWLHGEGGNERELRQLMPHVSVRNYVGVSVRGMPMMSGAGRAFTWDQSPDGADEAAERVRQAVDVAMQRLNIHPKRVYIAGERCGGTMALRLALRFPEWFGGAVSLGGPMPTGNAPLSRVNEARRLPLLLASCSDSRSYPQERVASDLKLLHAAGFSLGLRQYPGDHELTTVMLADVDRWLMAQVCPQMTSAAA